MLAAAEEETSLSFSFSFSAAAAEDEFANGEVGGKVKLTSRGSILAGGADASSEARPPSEEESDRGEVPGEMGEEPRLDRRCT